MCEPRLISLMGVMQTESIITTLFAAAAFLKKPIQDVAGQSVKDAFDAAKYYLRRKLGETSDAAKAPDMATEKPESEVRKAVLVEETKSAEIETTPSWRVPSGVARSIVFVSTLDGPICR
jgi:hypothetical protein